MSNVEKKEGVIPPAEQFCSAEFIRTSFRCQAYNQDYAYEAHTILRSKVELFLLTTLNGPRLKEWLPGKQEGGCYKIKDGTSALNLEYIANNPHLFFRTAGFPIINPNKQLYWTPGTSNDAAFEGARHFFVRVFSIANPIQKWASINRLEDSEQTETDNAPASILEKLDRQSTEHLAYHFGISDDITEDVNLGQAAWARSVVNMTFEKEADEKFILFLVEGDVLAYSVIIKKIHGRTVFLPVAFYVRTGDPTEILLYTMPHGNYPLCNANLIHRHQTASIFLTDILDLVLFNQSKKDVIFSSFYGGGDAVKKTDFSPLYGRNIYWLLLDKPGAEPLEKYRIAIKVYMQLHEHGVNFKVLKFNNHTWNTTAKIEDDLIEGHYDGITVMTVKEFLAEAENCWVHIPEALQENDYGLMTGSELEKKKQEPFMIEPVLRRKALLVLFADTGVGKSWAALSMSLALVHGKSVFQDKWKTNGKIHKVFYASGEMDDGEIGSRLKRLHEIYADINTNKDNFILKLGTYHDLASQEDQEEFSKAIHYATEHEGTPGLKVTVVVIDNLSTLTTNGEYAGVWNKVYRWICLLKEQGITVIVIHHSNRQSTIAGSAQISNKADKQIHAIQASTNDNISLVLKSGKTRSEPKSTAEPFKAEINLSAPNTGWTVTEVSEKDVEKLKAKLKSGKNGKSEKMKRTVPECKAWKALTESERITAIHDGWNRGDCNRQIAFNYNTSESTVSKFRQAASLRDSDLEKTKMEGNA